MLTPFYRALVDAMLEEYQDIPEDPEDIPDVPLSEFAVWENRETKILYSTIQPDCVVYLFATRENRAAFVRSRELLGYRQEPGPDWGEIKERR